MSKLTANKLKKLQGEVVKSRELKLNVQGEEYIFIYDTSYSNSKMESIIGELLSYQKYSNDNDIDFDVFTVLVSLVLKYMTDLPYRKSGSVKVKFEDLINTTAALKDIIDVDGKSVFENIIAVVINQDEINKMVGKIKTMTDNVVKFKEELTKSEEVGENADIH